MLEREKVLTKNACRRLDLNASLLVPSAFIAERPNPERSVKRPVWSGVSPFRSREMGSNLSE